MSATILQQAVLAPLMTACTAGDLPTLSSLLGAQQFSREDHDAAIFLLLANATENKRQEVVQYLLEQTTNVDFPEQLLMTAIFAGLGIYKLYLTKAPSILKHEWQMQGDVVCLALTQNDAELLTYLFETVGADPGRSHESSRIGYIFLPLEWAAYSSSVSNARLLLKYGAMVKSTAALQLAAAHRKLDMVRLLLDAGAEINGMVESHDISLPLYAKHAWMKGTALHFASERGFEDVVQYLMDNGADCSKVNTMGYTALEVAKKQGHEEIVCLIRSYQMLAG